MSDGDAKVALEEKGTYSGDGDPDILSASLSSLSLDPKTEAENTKEHRTPPRVPWAEQTEVYLYPREVTDDIDDEPVPAYEATPVEELSIFTGRNDQVQQDLKNDGAEVREPAATGILKRTDTKPREPVATQILKSVAAGTGILEPAPTGIPETTAGTLVEGT